MRITLVLLGVVAVVSASAFGTMVLSPLAAGQCAGTEWLPLENLFDWQPTWDGTAVVRDPDANGNFGAASAGMPGRWGYVDLGPDWANWRIEQVWTGYRQWSTGQQNTWTEKKWSNMDPLLADPLAIYDQNAIPETRLPFSTINLPYANPSRWIKEGDMTADPVIPQGRYLLMHSYADYGTLVDRASEYVFVGTIVPEPVTMTLLALGGLAILRRRGA